MSFRIEEKLYLRPENLIDFKKYIYNNSAEKLYKARKIQSLYFDNINLDMYNDSVEGLVPRKKIRVRNYPDDNDNNFYLEIKNSSVEGRFKTRKIIDKINLKKLKNHGILDSQYGACFPTFKVSYEREYIKFKDVRLSIDKNIIYESYNKNNYFSEKRIIVEIKTSIKKSADFLAEFFPFQRIRFSKYCFAVDALKN
jgi:hypothetical protein